jgi:superfamily II DNA or RNA helicase
MSLALRPYQEVGRDFLAGRRHALLADEMRVGKTPQAILAADKLGAERVLVVCPAIAVGHWAREWRKWTPETGRYELNVWSYDKMRNYWRSGEFKDQRWDVLIPDECHFVGNPSAARTAAVYGKTGFGHQVDTIWPLSGTPAPKTAASLWPMLRAFGKMHMTYAAFVRHYCVVNPMTLQPTGTKEHMIDELRAVLATFMLRRTRKDVAPEMPDIDFQFLEVRGRISTATATPIGLAMTDEQLLDFLERSAGSQAEFRVACAMAKVPQLIENIRFALENALIKQTVVFGYHLEPLQAVVDGLSGNLRVALLTGATSRAQRLQIQDDFAAGRIDVIVAQLLAAGVAIDLSAARHGYMLEMDWVPSNNLQAVNRLVSMDKLDKVTIDVVTWPGSSDDRIQRVLVRRTKELAKLLETV